MELSEIHPNSVANPGKRGPDPREDELYDRVIAALIEKQLRPGERLNENQLAQAHGLSRSRVRRVLERLEHEHLVRFELNRGAFISRPSKSEALDVYETRGFLEEGAVRLLCRRRPPRLPKTFESFLKKEEEAYRQADPNVNRISGDFHVLLADCAGNAELAKLIRNLAHRCCVIQSLYERPGTLLCLTHEHRDIVASIEEGDENGAIRAMRHHLEHIVASLRLDLRNSSVLDIYAPTRSSSR